MATAANLPPPRFTFFRAALLAYESKEVTMNVNVFGWIREGVRQSVLMGVADAMESIGTPPSGDDLRPKLMESIRRNSESAVAITAAAKPRRLGRTLKDLEGGAEA